jgi:hypothetical protein
MLSSFVQSIFRPRIAIPRGLPPVDRAGRCTACGKRRLTLRQKKMREREVRRDMSRTRAMASGDRLLDTSGNLLVSDGSKCPGNSGDAMLSNGTGDSCYCASCTTMCPGGRSTATVVFSSLTLCTGCLQSDAPIQISGTANGTFSVPYTRTQTGVCVFAAIVTTSFVVTIYSPGSCVTSTGTETTMYLQVFVFSSSSISITAFVPIGANIFNGSSSSGNICSSPITMANTYTAAYCVPCCSGPAANFGAYGGQATVSLT